MSNAVTELTSVSDLLAAIDREHRFHTVSEGITYDLWGGHVRLWFRGQADARWKLEPLVYRAGLHDVEQHLIRKERHITQDFQSFGAAFLTGRETDADIYFIMQHYRMPTRLLDWSGNPLAALYFATAESNRDEQDGKIFALDSYGFKGGHLTGRHEELSVALKSIFDWNDDSWPNYIMAVRPPMRDARIIAQSGYFTFHPQGLRYLEPSSNQTLREYLIPCGKKEGIRKELARMNINEFTIYGGLDRLGNWLRESYRKAAWET
jgi:FRG domain